MLCKLTVNCGVVSREKRNGKKKCDKKKLGKRKWPRSQAIGSQKQGKGTENIYKLGGEINST